MNRSVLTVAASFNMQEEFDGILSHNDNHRLVCKREMPVGSHFAATTCRTPAEIVQRRRETQHSLDTNVSSDINSANMAGRH